MPTIRTRAAKGSALSHNEVDANFKRTARQVTATGSILVSDNRGTVEGNHASVGITLTLPTVAAAGAAEPGDFIVRVTNINAAVVSVDGSTTETINGSTDAITLGQWESATFELDSASAGWVTTSRVGDLGAVNGIFTGNLTGNADTVTTNANLTGAITSTGNATSLGSFSSANLRGALTDETGTGAAVFATSPTLVTPALGTPSALVGTNITGTASGLTAGNVTTNANLTGDITSVGNATTLTNAAITGQTDIGAAIVDADQIILNDNGTGIRKADISRIRTYIAGAANAWTGDQTFNDEIIRGSDNLYPSILTAKQDTTSGTTKDFTSIPSWVTKITINMVNISCAATFVLSARLGDSGGFETTGYVAGTGYIEDPSNVEHLAYTGWLAIAASAAAGDAISGSVTLTLQEAATNTWVWHGVVNRAGTDRINMAAGYKSLSDTLTQLRITTTTGQTFDSGTVSITYE